MEKNSSTRARTEIEKRCAAERRKLARFLSKNGLNKEKIKSLDPVILNVSWMKSKLDDARTAIGEDGITVVDVQEWIDHDESIQPKAE